MSIDDSNKSKWLEPNSKQGVQWQGFLTTTLQDNKRKQWEAKCMYYKEGWLNGKPHKLLAHMKDSCSKMTPQQKSNSLWPVVDQHDTQPSDSSPEDQRKAQTSKQSIDNECLVVNMASKKAKNTSQGLLHNFTPMTKSTTKKPHELLLKAIISAHIPFLFLHNPYSIQYQQTLSQNPYTVPTCYSICDSILYILHTKNEIRVSELLEDKKFLTVSLDSWTDCSKSSMYATLVLKGTKLKEFMNVRNLHHTQHTLANTHAAFVS